MKTKIELENGDWGQIIDGLECRAEQYEKTVRYFESGEINGEIEEASSIEEARELADVYRRIIENIQRQQESTPLKQGTRLIEDRRRLDHRMPVTG